MLELHLAASRGILDVVEDALTKEPYRVNEVDEHGNTVLHRSGHLEMVKCLIRFGADPNVKNKLGDTPLDMMMRRGVDQKVIKFMEDITSNCSQEEDEHQLLLSRVHSAGSINLLKGKRGKMFGLLSEFMTGIGLRWFLTLIFFLLMLSFISAYIVTVGLAGQLELVPVEAPKNEL